MCKIVFKWFLDALSPEVQNTLIELSKNGRFLSKMVEIRKIILTTVRDHSRPQGDLEFLFLTQISQKDPLQGFVYVGGVLKMI